MTDQMEYQEKGPLMICNHRVWLAVAVRAEDRDVVMEMEVCVVYVCEERERAYLKRNAPPPMELI